MENKTQTVSFNSQGEWGAVECSNLFIETFIKFNFNPESKNAFHKLVLLRPLFLYHYRINALGNPKRKFMRKQETKSFLGIRIRIRIIS